MPRGGRRRSRGRRRRPVERSSPTSGQPTGDQTGRRRRRRRGRGQGGSALERMVAEGKSTTVQTLPADGTVLEEVIADMQSNYGTPTTPQEFRLIVKVLGGESAAIPTEPADPQEAPQDASSTVTAGGSADGRRRRRRRRRRPGAPPGRKPESGESNQ